MKNLNKIKIFLCLVFLFPVACKKSGFAPSAATVDSLYQLAYGSSTSDRTQLANRISGNVPPKFAEVISKWKRFSGTTYYPTVPALLRRPVIVRRL